MQVVTHLRYNVSCSLGLSHPPSQSLDKFPACPARRPRDLHMVGTAPFQGKGMWGPALQTALELYMPRVLALFMLSAPWISLLGIDKLV